jgi:DNA-binding MarR family transcriptional regulator
LACRPLETLMTAHSGKVDARRPLQLGKDVGRIAGPLASLSMGLAAPRQCGEPASESAPPEVSAEAVEYIIRARRERERFVPRDLFAEPAWDMMLDLLHCEIRGRRVAVSDLCLAAAVPHTTAMRWISTMVQRGLLTRESDPADKRRVFIRLAPEISMALRRYFAEIIGAA